MTHGAAEPPLRPKRLIIPASTLWRLSSSLAWNSRCKHKCKGECRHVCCQDSRERYVSTKPREFHVQSSVLRVGSDSTTDSSPKPVAPPTNASMLFSHKRKADEASGDDNSEAPDDLLSRLDRLYAEHDKAVGVAQLLNTSACARDRFASGSRSHMGENAAIPFHSNRSSAIHGFDTAHPSMGEDATEASLQLANVRCNCGPVVDTTSIAQSPELLQRVASSISERPAQRRFLRTLDNPPWLAGSDANR